MPHLFRTRDGRLWKPGPSLSLSLTFAGGTPVEAVWAGSAREEKLAWRLGQPGNELAQTGEVSEIAIKADDTGDAVWGAAPAGARLIFVLEPPPPGKNYRLARMVTTKAAPAQVIYFRHERFALFGTLKPDGAIEKIQPLPPPPPVPPAQGNLF